MQDLLQEYMQTATNISNKINKIQSSLKHLRGEPYFLAQRQLTQLEEMYAETCWTIRDIVKYLE